MSHKTLQERLEMLLHESNKDNEKIPDEKDLMKRLETLLGQQSLSASEFTCQDNSKNTLHSRITNSLENELSEILNDASLLKDVELDLGYQEPRLHVPTDPLPDITQDQLDISLVNLPPSSFVDYTDLVLSSPKKMNTDLDPEVAQLLNQVQSELDFEQKYQSISPVHVTLGPPPEPITLDELNQESIVDNWCCKCIFPTNNI